MDWFRKEDWWILVIACIMLLFGGCVACLSNSIDKSEAECAKKGGELIYLDKSGYYCIQKGVIIR